MVGHPGPPTSLPSNIKSGGGEGGAACMDVEARCSTKLSGAELLVIIYGPYTIIYGPYVILYGP